MKKHLLRNLILSIAGVYLLGFGIKYLEDINLQRKLTKTSELQDEIIKLEEKNNFYAELIINDNLSMKYFSKEEITFLHNYLNFTKDDLKNSYDTRSNNNSIYDTINDRKYLSFLFYILNDNKKVSDFDKRNIFYLENLENSSKERLAINKEYETIILSMKNSLENKKKSIKDL